MRAYFSHSIIADKHENFGFNLWIDTCINLLKYIKEDGVNISDEQPGEGLETGSGMLQTQL